MSIRKLNEYLDISRLGELMLNVVEPIGENGNALALAKISESNGLPLWDDEAWPGGSVDSQAGSTTDWSSLGTISFPFAQSGKIIIKRLA